MAGILEAHVVYRSVYFATLHIKSDADSGHTLGTNNRQRGFLQHATIRRTFCYSQLYDLRLWPTIWRTVLTFVLMLLMMILVGGLPILMVKFL